MKRYYPIVLLLLFAGFSTAIAQFHVDTLAQAPAIGFPVAIAFPPDSSNRLFFTEKNKGNVRIIQNDSLLPQPFLTVPVKSYGEQGLLGITFHPGYPDSPYVYVYYTRQPDSANVVVRYTDSAGVGINPFQLMIVTKNRNTPSHNGGNLHFGPDGKLYVTIGDNFTASNAQDISDTNKRGKIHRLNPDGGTPADNPFPGKTMYVYGCRNSFDFTFDALTGKLYSTENGPGCNDEINHIVAGGNYGWPNDGNCTYVNASLYKKPMYYWQTPPSVTGITVYRGNIFPELYGKMLVTSYNFGKVFQFGLNVAGDSVTGAPKNLIFHGSNLNDIEVGPDGFIYVANGSYTGASRILRLRPAIIIPATPALHLPVADAGLQPVQMNFVWRQSPESHYYDFQIAQDSNFTEITIDTATQVDTSITIQSLEYSTTYFWRVRARNSLGASEYSPARTYTTVLEPPPAPLLASPDHNAGSQPVAPKLYWHLSERADSYTLQVATNSNFTPVAHSYAGITDTSKELSALANATTYYWRVNAKNIGGTSLYSVSRTFTTIIAAPASPGLLSPINQSLDQPISVTLQWANIASSTLYHVQVSLDSNNTNIIFEHSTVADSVLSIDSLSYGTRYYWRVRGSNAGGYGAWSSSWNFKSEFKYFPVTIDWNLISLPLDVTGKTRQSLFPTSASYAFTYIADKGYSRNDTLSTGKGYWLKFDSSETVALPGRNFRNDTLDLVEGWNMLGSLSDTMFTDNIVSVPPGILVSSFLGFNDGYYAADAIIPGRGYWVKSSSDGIIVLSSGIQR